MTYEADQSYIRQCKRLGITPSAEDYRDYIADAEAQADDPREREDEERRSYPWPPVRGEDY